MSENAPKNHYLALEAKINRLLDFICQLRTFNFRAYKTQQQDLFQKFHGCITMS